MIKTSNLTKKYGDLFAIQSIELDLAAGDLFGFIGPNGAGKTTTMRILATLLNPTWGEAYVCGHSIYSDPKEIRRLVGYMPDFFGVYDDMKVIEYLEFFAAAYRINGPQAPARSATRSWNSSISISSATPTPTRSAAGRRSGSAWPACCCTSRRCCCSTNRSRGLDPRARIEMRAVLRRLGQQGKTIMVSSHILPELADMCNKVGIIDRGVMNVNATVADVMKQVRERIVLHIGVTGDRDAAARLLEQSDLVEGVTIAKPTSSPSRSRRASRTTATSLRC